MFYFFRLLFPLVKSVSQAAYHSYRYCPLKIYLLSHPKENLPTPMPKLKNSNAKTLEIGDTSPNIVRVNGPLIIHFEA